MTDQEKSHNMFPVHLWGEFLLREIDSVKQIKGYISRKLIVRVQHIAKKNFAIFSGISAKNFKRCLGPGQLILKTENKMRARIIQTVLAVSVFLEITSASVLAGEKIVNIPPVEPKSDWVGWVSSDGLQAGKVTSFAPAPNASSSTASLPGGGNAWAQAYLAWAPLRMDAAARTGLSGTTKQYYVASRVVQVYKAGQAMGGSQRIGSWTSSGPIEAWYSVYFGSVYGFLWRNDTSHLVTDYMQFQWGPQNSVSVTP